MGFVAALEHPAASSRSITASSAPPPDQRYQQDHDLFAFVACAFSAIECFHFAAYCMGALANRPAFPLSQPSRRRLYPRDGRDRFGGTFPDEPLAAALAAEWRYEFSLAADCLHPYTAWLEHSVRTLIIAAAAFTDARCRRTENAPG